MVYRSLLNVSLHGTGQKKDIWGAAEPERGKTAQLIPQLFFENMYLFTWSCVNVLQSSAFPRAGQEWCFQGMFSLRVGRPSMVHLLRKYIPIPQKPNLTTM